MTFLHPEFLYYMLPPLFILFGFLLTQKESQAHFFSKEVMDKLRVSANTLTLQARNALFLLMGFFMIIALAQPVIKEGKAQVRAKSADIMIAIDISDSMLAADIYPNRLEAAKQKVLALLGGDFNERVGIVAFAKNSYLVSPLSFDKSAVSFLLSQLDTSSITEKGTDFSSVLDVVSKTQESQDKKCLLLLSDGGDNSDFKDEIELAKKHNITVFILGTATKKGSPIKLQDGTFIKYNGDIIISKLNEKIADLATNTGGVYIESTTSLDDIKTMLSEIKSVSDKKELKSQEIQKNRPLFYYPLGVALFILIIATSSLNKRKSVSAAYLLISLLFNSSYAQAGMFDFMELKKAKEAYENGEFEESAKLYEKYAKESAKPEGYFNAGNAFYKQKKYKEAIESYNKAAFNDENAKAKNLSNLGNAYAKEAKQDSLQKAKEAYEKSLGIKEDKETRENLQEVEKLLEKQKENEQNKDKENKQNDKDQDSKEGEKKSDEKDKSKEHKESSKDKESKDKEKSSDEAKSQKEQNGKSDQPKQDGKKDEQKELDKSDKNTSKSSHTREQKPDKESMSDAEQQKWIEQLSTKNSTYLYKLNDEKTKNENLNYKPW
ncbi:MAG: VWA domain-containing protein [Sulfurimonas sp.]|uniref:VWA domain-containing protein n=1 Tax=Sulfurimonas sp. TaxID=2022749 RepID=UPI002608E498|nr:VWA domain-containing protein [Sulfurimonas sp.]MDD5400249.1 VWA domain-containing protein [Sulfurimonas sp.]